MQRNISVRYGLIVGSLLTIFMWASAFIFNSDSELNKAGFLGFITMVISFTFLYIGVRKYREVSDNQLDFKMAFKVGLTIALIASICYVISWMVYYQIFGQDYIANYQQQYLESLQASGMNELEIGEQKLHMQVMSDKYQNPFFRIGVSFMEVIPIGIIFSFFSALILRK